MSVGLKNLPWRWLRGKQKDPKLKNGASVNPNPNPELSLWESEASKLPLIAGGSNNVASKSGKLNRKLHTRQEQEIDRENDVILVPSDGGCISDSDSDASDWSVGWSEPHGPDFHSDEEIDGGFGVLVPCYGAKHRVSGKGVNEAVEMKVNADGKKYMDQWLNSLQTS